MPVTATSGQLLEEIHQAIATLPVENKAQLNTLYTYGLVPEWLVALHHPDVLPKEKRDLTPFQPNEEPVTQKEYDFIQKIVALPEPKMPLPKPRPRLVGVGTPIHYTFNTDNQSSILVALASVPRTKAAILRFLYNAVFDSRHLERAWLWPALIEVVRNPWCPPDLLADFAESTWHPKDIEEIEKEKLPEAVAAHPNTSREMLGGLLSEKLPLAGVAGLALLKHPDATLEEEQRAAALVLAYSAEEELVALLATAQTDNAHLLHELSLEGHWSWRLGVALNRHTPPELLASLAHDDYPLVRAAAQARLQGEDFPLDLPSPQKA